MLAIDWAHTRKFAVYDGKEAELLDWAEVMERAQQAGAAVIERGAPLMYLYRLVKSIPTYPIDPQVVAEERERQRLDKTDLNDARVIWSLGSENGLEPLTLDDGVIQLAYLYHQYLYALKAQMATNNLTKAMRRHFGEARNTTLWLLDQHNTEYETHCKTLQSQIQEKAPLPPRRVIRIKGISNWLWAGIIVCADPRVFSSKSSYRKYCGLLDRKSMGHKFSRKASRVYWLCADSLMKQRTPGWREIYDDAKEALASRDGYTHPHGGALNRLMTAFANFVYDTVQEEGLVQQGPLF